LGRQADDQGKQQHRHKQNQGRQTAKQNIERSFHTAIARLNPSSTAKGGPQPNSPVLLATLIKAC
jgi:hypothetical protein